MNNTAVIRHSKKNANIEQLLFEATADSQIRKPAETTIRLDYTGQPSIRAYRNLKNHFMARSLLDGGGIPIAAHPPASEEFD
jgi:hypothetical protein